MSEALKIVGVDCKVLLSNDGEYEFWCTLTTLGDGYVQATCILMQL
jgi:hypothetical protein